MIEAAEGAAGIELCTSAELTDGGRAKVFDLLQWGRPARGFVLRHGGQVVAYVNRCLHVPTEMDWIEGQFLDAEARYIVCSIHGATYEPRDGRCIGGPCGRGRLTPIEVHESEGRVAWYPSADLTPVVFDAPPTAP
jgi:nitrite reductase/ring-hydroxylating ferredoxin subunit